MVKDLKKASNEFKKILLDYENAIITKSGNFLEFPNYKVLHMKRKLARFEKKEGIKRYSLLEETAIYENEKKLENTL